MQVVRKIKSMETVALEGSRVYSEQALCNPLIRGPMIKSAPLHAATAMLHQHGKRRPTRPPSALACQAQSSHPPAATGGASRAGLPSHRKVDQRRASFKDLGSAYYPPDRLADLSEKKKSLRIISFFFSLLD